MATATINEDSQLPYISDDEMLFEILTDLGSTDEVVDGIIEAFRKLPENCRDWDRSIFKDGKNGDERCRTYIEHYEEDEEGVCRVTTGLFPPIFLDKLKRKSKPNTMKKQKIRERVRWDETFESEHQKEEFKGLLLQLINACCKPEEKEEDVWLGNPVLQNNLYTADNKLGKIRRLVKYITLALKEIRRRKHDDKRKKLDCYEGRTLHETIESLLSEDREAWNVLAIGRRSEIGKVLQSQICLELKISKDEFKAMHYKKKHLYSENYFVVYRPEEQYIIERCIYEEIARALQDRPVLTSELV